MAYEPNCLSSRWTFQLVCYWHTHRLETNQCMRRILWWKIQPLSGATNPFGSMTPAVFKHQEQSLLSLPTILMGCSSDCEDRNDVDVSSRCPTTSSHCLFLQSACACHEIYTSASSFFVPTLIVSYCGLWYALRLQAHEPWAKWRTWVAKSVFDNSLSLSFDHHADNLSPSACPMSVKL